MRNGGVLPPAAGALIACLLVFFSLSPLAGQQGGDVAVPWEEEEAPAEESLFLKTLAQDISTADYYELLAWCRNLGLEDAGNRRALQARLYEHYGVQSPAEKPGAAGAGEGRAASTKSVVVPQAGSTSYYRIEEAEEDYLLLQGDVVVEFMDEEQDVLHRISAERIVVNRTENMLTAQGQVEYLLQRGEGKPEIFRSESFSFDLENWAGVFVEGRGETVREIEEGEPTRFFFRGSSISRRADDVVLLEKGDVTSCEHAEAPHWRIAASRIYVLAPGEWAIRDAVLYVGRVPLLYIPFFFKPGDEFFFHPTVGYRNREGWYIQTTTYLEGTPEQEESAFSFLQVTEEDDAAAEREIRGLFLRTVEPGEGPDGGEAEIGGKAESGNTLKLMADVYTRLGGFFGLVADYGPLWQLKGGLGVSRSLFPVTGGYTPFPDADPRSHWDYSLFFGLPLPLRYGIETNLNLGDGGQSFSGRIEYYSDPFFPEDFYKRTEKFDWASLIQGQEAAAAGSRAGWDLSPGTRNAFTWQARTRLDLPFQSPAIRQLALNRFDVTLDWQSKSGFFYPSRLIAPSTQLVMSGTLLDLPREAESQRPEGEEPWPEGGRAGPAYRLPALEEEAEEAPEARKQEAQEGEAREGEAREPEGGEPTGEAAAEIPDGEPGEKPSGRELFVPPPREDLPVDLPRFTTNSFALSYTFTPRFLLENQFDHPTWFTPQDVDFSSRYLTLDTSGDLSLASIFHLGRGVFTGSHGLSLSGAYNETFNRGPTISDVEWYFIDVEDYLASGVDLSSDLELKLYPLAGNPFLRSTSLRYELDWDIFTYRLESYVPADPVFGGRLLPWDAEAVSRHGFYSDFVFTPGDTAHLLKVTAILPPLDMVFLGELDFTVGPLRSNIRGGFRQEGVDWSVDPLSVSETADFAPWAVTVQKLAFDWEALKLQEATTNMKLFKLYQDDPRYLLEQELTLSPGATPWARSRTTVAWRGWQSSFLLDRRLPLEFDKDTGEWNVSSATESFLPSRFLVSYRKSVGPAVLWKNRIHVEGLLRTSLDLDFQRFTQSVLDFTWKASLGVHRFLDFSLTVESWNRRLYRYVRPWALAVGLAEAVNPLADLLRSFNFFGIDARKASSFNLRSVSLTAVHQLHDWDLSFDFSVRQDLQTDEDGRDSYVWMPVFTLLLEWYAIPEFSRSIRKDEQGINLRG